MSTLGFHLDGRICRVGCSFCYLGARRGAFGSEVASERMLPPALLSQIVGGIVEDIVERGGVGGAAVFRDIAVAVSEPARRWRAGLTALAASARARGVGLAITTTPDVVVADPWVLDGARRVSLSVDPEKYPEKYSSADDALPPGELLERALAACARPGLEVVALVSVTSPEFAATLADDLLAKLLDDPRFHHVALNGIKPPPPWCDRAFWLRFCGRIRPLLERHLHRRLHLDCYVGARILGLGGCPAKPDVSPGREFRACVYQATPDFVFTDANDLATRIAAYVPPAACPFEIR